MKLCVILNYIAVSWIKPQIKRTSNVSCHMKLETGGTHASMFLNKKTQLKDDINPVPCTHFTQIQTV